ncbi:hypothetical protein [Prosthecomicrobium sp. N25]|uniref:hypothetical protein n=1 Tax=Prosthecomicrobium sp. N25 TaxID=3129254 RepID=UPI003076CC9D
MILFRIVWRLIVMQVGLALAGAAAAGAIVAGLDLLSQIPPELGIPRVFGPRGVRAADFVVFGTAFGLVMNLAMPFGFLAALLAELLSIRHLFFHLVAGAAVGAWAFAQPDGRLMRMPMMTPEAIAPFVAAGLVGGFVYWLVAGRGAGFRRDAASAPRPAPASRPAPEPRSLDAAPPSPPAGAPGRSALGRVGWGRPPTRRETPPEPPPSRSPVMERRIMPPGAPRKPVVERRPR